MQYIVEIVRLLFHFSLTEGDLFFFNFTEESYPGVGGSAINQRLMMAIEDKDTETMEYCLQNGADANVQYGVHQVTPLHLATAQGSPEGIRLLLDNGADIRKADARGVTPVHVAAGLGDAVVLEKLIQFGGQVNVHDLVRENGFGGETPLHRAAIGGHFAALVQLLRAGAKVFFSGVPMFFNFKNNDLFSICSKLFSCKIYS